MLSRKPKQERPSLAQYSSSVSLPVFWLYVTLSSALFPIIPTTLPASPLPDLSVFDKRAREGSDLGIVFLGGSLAWGAQATNPQETSYRALVGKNLAAFYPKAHFQFADAAIGGTGSQLAAFRLERDVLSRKPDLVFLDFTINDDAYGEPVSGRLASYESLVRRLVQAGVPVVQVILPAKKDVEANPPERPLDAKHKDIAAAYGIPVADAVALVKKRVAAGINTADQLWDLPDDPTHPGDAGYALYAEAVWKAFDQAVSGNKACLMPGKMLHAETYMTVNRHQLALDAAFPEGWETGKPHRNAIAYDFVCSRWMGSLAIAHSGASPLRLRVSAEEVLLFGEQTKISGGYEVRVDGGEPRAYSANCSEGNRPLVQTIAVSLDPAKEHEIEISPLLKPGEELRIESVCAAGGKATVFLQSE